MDEITRHINDLFFSFGMNETAVRPLSALTTVLCTIVLAYALYLILTKIAEPILRKITLKTAFTWDDIIFRHSFLRWIWIFASFTVCHICFQSGLNDYPTLKNVLFTVTQISLLLIGMKIVTELIKSAFLLITEKENIDHIARQLNENADDTQDLEYKPTHSLKGLQQMLILIVGCITLILAVSILFGKNPLIIFSGLGAGAAVLMLIFKDSILGVVAGIQLTANDMLQPGDWISAPKYGVNGIVKDVTLATVKIQNWDKTIVTVPPYLLVSDAFQNWRGMQDAGGRRIARSINIDMNSIRFLTASEAKALGSEPWATTTSLTDSTVNLTAFRTYLEFYLSTLPTLRGDMLFMVRELQPTQYGLPLEFYLFTSQTEWKQYEQIQADLTDTIIAMMPRFGLKVFQLPIGVCSQNA